MLLYAFELLCFQVIISPTSWASAWRWRWLSSQFSRLMFPLHQQNIWESKHKAGEWESQPEGLAGGRAQVEGRGCSEHGPMSPPCTLGAWDSGAGCWGSICAAWSLPKSQHVEKRQENLLSTETSLQ